MKIYFLISYLLISSYFFLSAQDVIQQGKAGVWDEAPSKYTAAHATAPKGAIIAVKNFVNGKVLYLEVTQNLAKSVKDEPIVLISSDAYEELALNLYRNQVELSYNLAQKSNEYIVDQDNYIIHRVKQEDNLYVLANHYQVKMSELRLWNNLPNDILYPEQRLIIYNRSRNLLASRAQPLNESLPNSLRRSNNSKRTERGRVRIVQTQKQRGALHRSAIPGTLIIIINPKNSKSTVVEVEGALSSTQAAQGTIIGIPKSAYQRLGLGNSLSQNVRIVYNVAPNPMPLFKANPVTALKNTMAQYLPDPYLYHSGDIVFHKSFPLGYTIEVKNPENNRTLTLHNIGRLSEDVKDSNVDLQLPRAALYYLNDEKDQKELKVKVRALSSIVADPFKLVEQLANVHENGLAEPFKDIERKNKFTALHKTAPIGTWILIETAKVNNNQYRPIQNTYSNRANTFNSAQASNFNPSQPRTVRPYNPPTPPQSTDFPTNQNLHISLGYYYRYTPKRTFILVEVVGRLADNEANKDISLKLSEIAYNALNVYKPVAPVMMRYYQYSADN